jgi:hypothetical protein
LSGLRAWLALAESSQGDKQQSGACDDGYAAKFGQPYAMASILGHIEFPLYSRNVRGSPKGTAYYYIHSRPANHEYLDKRRF